MRVAFFRGDICDQVIEIAPDQIEAFRLAYGCDHYLPAPLDDSGLRALGEGAKIAGAAARLVAGTREIDRARVALTPAAAVPAAEIVAATKARDDATEARAAELVAAVEPDGK